MKYLFVLLVAAPLSAGADEIARHERDWVRFTHKPCVHETIVGLLGPRVDTYREATAFLGGQTYAACWSEMGELRHLVYEDGDQGVVPESAIQTDGV